MNVKVELECNISKRVDLMRLEVLGLMDYMTYNDIQHMLEACRELTKAYMQEKKAQQKQDNNPFNS